MDALKQTDSDVFDLIIQEEQRQRDTVRLIPSVLSASSATRPFWIGA